MACEEIGNNEALLDTLSRIMRSGNIHHGYIFEGPSTADKLSIAKYFAKGILCKSSQPMPCEVCSSCKKVNGDNHIDITYLEATAAKGSKTLSIKDRDIEELINTLKKKPFDGNRNIAIIKDGDLMTRSSCNHLLKTLEEPPVGTVIMILSENINIFPNTILSRCVHMRVNPWLSANKEKNQEVGETLVKLLKELAPYYKLKKVIDTMEKDKKQGLILLDTMEGLYGEQLKETKEKIQREKIYADVMAIEEARSEITRDFNATYAIKKMVLTIGGQ